MGLLDLPAPLFASLDQLMAMALPAAFRVIIWGALGGATTMALYRLLSPQAKIGQAKRAAREARRRLYEFDGELADAGPMISDQFTAAAKHIGLVLPATLAAMLPLLALLVWLDTSYSLRYPEPGERPDLTVTPAGLQADWTFDEDAPRITVRDGNALRAEFALSAPVPVIEQRHWWNWLVANPLGYLPDDSGVERVTIDLPSATVLPVGPEWARSWLTMFFPAMVLVSLLIFRWARIE